MGLQDIGWIGARDDRDLAVATGLDFERVGLEGGLVGLGADPVKAERQSGPLGPDRPWGTLGDAL